MRAVPTFLRIAGRHNQTLVTQPVGQIDPELSEIAHSLAYFLHQLVQSRGVRAPILRQCLLIEIQGLQLQLVIVPASTSTQHRPAATGEHALRHILAALLEVHNRFGNFQINRTHQHLDIERPQQPIGDLVHSLCVWKSKSGLIEA